MSNVYTRNVSYGRLPLFRSPLYLMLRFMKIDFIHRKLRQCKYAIWADLGRKTTQYYKLPRTIQNRNTPLFLPFLLACPSSDSSMPSSNIRVPLLHPHLPGVSVRMSSCNIYLLLGLCGKYVYSVEVVMKVFNLRLRKVELVRSRLINREESACFAGGIDLEIRADCRSSICVWREGGDSRRYERWLRTPLR
jgi:hypothetical protein